MTITVNFAAWASSDTYDLTPLNLGLNDVVTRTYTNPETGTTTSVTVTTIDVQNHVYGYTIGNETTIAIRGTADFRDGITDAGVVIGLTPERNETIVRSISEYRRDHPSESITFTGHSLGGYEAAVMSSTFSYPAIVFNAPAGPAIENPSQVWSISDTSDVIGHFGGVFTWSGYPNRIDVPTDATAAFGPNGTHTMSNLMENIRHSVGLITLSELQNAGSIQIDPLNSTFRLVGTYTDSAGTLHSVTTVSLGDGMLHRTDIALDNSTKAPVAYQWNDVSTVVQNQQERTVVSWNMDEGTTTITQVRADGTVIGPDTRPAVFDARDALARQVETTPPATAPAEAPAANIDTPTTPSGLTTDTAPQTTSPSTGETVDDTGSPGGNEGGNWPGSEETTNTDTTNTDATNGNTDDGSSTEGDDGGDEPVVLDLDGNGIHLSSAADGVAVDLSGTGWSQRTGWVSDGDGFLALDRNGNGVVDAANEIVLTSVTPGATTDLNGLRSLDTNGDGVLSAADQRFAELSVWQDANRNGTVDAGEVQALASLGIASISLTTDHVEADVNGNTIHGLGSFTRADGSSGTVADGSLVSSLEASTAGLATITGQAIVSTNDANLQQAFNGDDANEVAIMTDGNDAAWGRGGNDYLVAGGGDDVVFGGDGNDLLTGGTGHDWLSGDAGNDLVYGESGDDTLYGGAGDDRLDGGDGSDTLYGGSGSDRLDGGSGRNNLYGGSGDDTYFVHSSTDAIREDVSGGNDSVIANISYRLGDEVENLSLTGNADLAAIGNALDNRLVGNAGANVLDGGTGADDLRGGAGDDLYVVDNAGDQVSEYMGEGNDTVLSSVDYTLGANVEHLNLAATNSSAVYGTGNALGNIIIGNAQNNVLDGQGGMDQIWAGAGDDYVSGGSGSDILLGEDGNDALLGGSNTDYLFGGAGSDLLDGGEGTDTMLGGAGDDTYLVSEAFDEVIEAADQGTDTVIASINYTLTANVENLILTGDASLGIGNAADNLIRNQTGYASYLYGDAGVDHLEGGAVDDILDGGTGADTLIGSAGNDSYVVDNSADQTVEDVGGGADTVYAAVDWTLAANVENLVLTGAAISGMGNELANTITGNAQDNVLDGATGSDTLIGGAGDDAYVVDNALDTVVELADEGTDTVLSSVSHALSSNVENLTLTGAADIDATGNALNNTLTGNGGNNLLDGSTGADAMAGAAGDDSYVVDDAGDTVSEWFDAGMDSVLAGINYVLPQHVENLRLTGNAVTATGNTLDNRLYGNAQGNLIDGDAGADQMAGAAGDDTYVVDNAQDAVIERVDEGNDTILASVSYALSSNVENLTLTGSADLAATGNTLNNVILGNTGNNLIDGGMGADVMAGGAGNDRYLVDDALDTVIETVVEGVDTIEASVSYTLSNQVENLVLTGAAVQGTGNDLDNRLTGNAQDNLLDGAVGADIMAGGAGNDTYTVDNAADTIEELAGEGKDTVLSSVSYALSAHVDNLVLTGIADISATGNELDNTLTGNTGNNALAGGAGNDTYVYTVGSGLDTILDTSGVDTVSFGPGLTLDNVALRIATVNGQKMAQIRVLDATGNEIADQGIDYVMSVDAQGRLISPLESFVFADGGSYDWSYLLIQSTPLIGTSKADLLLGGRNDDAMFGHGDRDVLYGGSGYDQLSGEGGDDILFGGGGNDKLYGGNGDDELHGEAGDDWLDGNNGKDLLIDLQGNNTFYAGNDDDTVRAGAGNDTIYTDNGRDIVQAGAGVDRIDSGNENDLVDAGTGDDTISTGNSDDWIAAGQGNDVIDGGNGRNLYAFNRGDGVDLLANSGNGRDTVSLGGSIRYADLTLAKAGNDLVLGMGAGDSMTLKNWYAGNNSKSVEKLQVVTVGGDYDANSADKTRNKQVEVFDFSKLVQKFDAARAANSANANGWAVMNSLLDAHLQGSNTAALGGDLSYQYASTGSLAGIGLAAAQSSLAAGTDWQNLKGRSQLEQGSVKLM